MGAFCFPSVKSLLTCSVLWSSLIRSKEILHSWHSIPFISPQGRHMLGVFSLPEECPLGTDPNIFVDVHLSFMDGDMVLVEITFHFKITRNWWSWVMVLLKNVFALPWLWPLATKAEAPFSLFLQSWFFVFSYVSCAFSLKFMLSSPNDFKTCSESCSSSVPWGLFLASL